MEKVLKLLLVFVFILQGGFLYAEPSQKDLAEIQSKAKEKENELKKIKEEEQKLSKELTALQKKQQQTQQLINKIEYDKSLVEQSRITTANKKEALDRALPVWQGNLEEETQLVILNSLQNASYFDSDSLLEDILLDRALEHKSSFAVQLKKENKVAQERIEVFEEKSSKLSEQAGKVTQQRSLLTKDFQKMKVSLGEAQARHKAAQKELDELNKSAKDVMKLLAAAETKRQKEAEREAKAQGESQKPQAVAEIGASANSLPRPVSGEVLTKFGKEYNKDLNVSIFRDGIKIAAKKNESVYSVAEGTVIYSGNFRSYGNVVILDHGKGFFSIYGFLSEINVENGDSVGARTPIGIAGTDTQQGSMGTGRIALYFEIRKGTTAVDPEIYLR